MPEGAVYVGRPSRFGNPFSGPGAAGHYRRWLSGRMSRAEFRRWRTNPWALYHDRTEVLRELPRLRGRDLACWCGPGEDCHADVLLALANGVPPAESAS